MLSSASRRLFQAQPAGVKMADHYRVLIIGAGAGGLAVASHLRLNHRAQLQPTTTTTTTAATTTTDPSIALIDPSDYHYYQPLWTLVGGGVKSFLESRRLMADLVKSLGLPTLIKQSVLKVDPHSKQVQLNDSRKIGYDYLVLAPGIQCRWDRIPGLADALADPDCPVSSNYHAEYVTKTAQLLKTVEFGKSNRAIFTQPSTPIKCAGAPQKIMYLAEEFWRRARKLADIKVDFFTGAGKLFAVEKYAQRLSKICNDRQINVHLGQELVQILPKTRQDLKSNQMATVDFDFLHATPPMSPPAFISESGLGNAAGFVEVDPKTLQHTRYENIFALGDASSIPTSKTAAAIAAQCGVLAYNLAQQINTDLSSTGPSAGVKRFREYDGYTSCPLVTGRGKLILAEFNGFTLEPRETFWFDQGVERSTMYTLKANVLPTVYWDGLLKGVWDGPGAFRKFLNPFNRN